jgi:hypothetical protein
MEVESQASTLTSQFIICSIFPRSNIYEIKELLAMCKASDKFDNQIRTVHSACSVASFCKTFKICIYSSHDSTVGRQVGQFLTNVFSNDGMQMCGCIFTTLDSLFEIMVFELCRV